MAGSTSNFYNKPGNEDHKLKHIRDNSPGGKYAHSKKYKREHAEARRLNDTPKHQDVVRNKNGKLVNGNRYQNRAEGGRKGARRRMAKKNARLKIA